MRPIPANLTQTAKSFQWFVCGPPEGDRRLDIS
jgi:hypothetical protein